MNSVSWNNFGLNWDATRDALWILTIPYRHEWQLNVKFSYVKVKVEQSTIAKFENDETITNGVDGNTSDVTGELDVTGTPLEDNCEITVIGDWSVMKKLIKTNPWTDEEEQIASVNVELVTKIVNDVNTGLGSKCNNGSIFAICGESDDHQFLLHIEYDKDWNWRGVGKFTVSLSYNKNMKLFLYLIVLWFRVWKHSSKLISQY